MNGRRIARSSVAFLAATVALYVLGSALIDALLPAGSRPAMVLTAPGRTGSFLRDYAVPAFQVLVLAVATVIAVRWVRRPRVQPVPVRVRRNPPR